MLLSKTVLISILLAISTSVSATVLQATYVRQIDDAGDYYGGVAVDQKSGVIYQRGGFGPGYSGSAVINKYANAAAFEAGTSMGSVSNAALWGTYFAVNNGTIYGRGTGNLDGNNWPADAFAVEVSANTGVVLKSSQVANMGGINGVHTFNWGGFSGVNAMSSGNNLLYVGGVANQQQWMVARYDNDLNSLGSVSFAMTTAGWAFAINDYVYFGSEFNSGNITSKVNSSTGELTNIDFQIKGLNSDTYISNSSYDALNDTLYLSSARSLYKVENIGRDMGVRSSSDIPEPVSVALFGLGLAGLIYTSRKAR